MPTYDYECEACGHTEEIFQPITAEPLNKCPQCKKKKFKRLFGTGAAVVFKGSGFYQTDYRSESYKKGAEKEAKSSEPASRSEGGAAAGGSKPDAAAKPAAAESPPAKPKKKKAE